MLDDAGLVRRRSQGREVRCGLVMESLQVASTWIDGERRGWTARLVDASVDEPAMSAFEDLLTPEAVFPDREAILKAWEAASRALLGRLPEVTRAELARPAPMRFPVDEQTIIGGIAFLTEHEGYHMGQLGFLVKALQYEAVVYS